MFIKLKWVNPNADKTGVVTKILRRDPNVAEAEIATIAEGVTEYLDEDVVYGVVYTYRIQFELDGVIVTSNEVSYPATFSKGPGPQVLEMGDEKEGYFGGASAKQTRVVDLHKIIGGLLNIDSPFSYTKVIRDNRIMLVYSATFSTVLSSSTTVAAMNAVADKVLAGFDFEIDGYAVRGKLATEEETRWLNGGLRGQDPIQGGFFKCGNVLPNNVSIASGLTQIVDLDGSVAGIYSERTGRPGTPIATSTYFYIVFDLV